MNQFDEKEKQHNKAKAILSTGFSVTSIATIVVAVPIGLTIFEKSFSSQVSGGVDKNKVVDLKSDSDLIFSEEDFIRAVENLKLFDKYRHLTARMALGLAREAANAFNFLDTYDYTPITKHSFKISLDISDAFAANKEVKAVVVSAYSQKYQVTYSRLTSLKGWKEEDGFGDDIIDYQINQELSGLSLSSLAPESAHLLASEMAFRLDNDFQVAYKKTGSRAEAFRQALIKNYLGYNLVNRQGLPTMLQKGYVLAPKTIENKNASEEKLVNINENDRARVNKLQKVENLAFKNLSDPNGTLSITFELWDPNGKLVSEYDFKIKGIKKLDFDLKKQEEKVLQKVTEFVEIKPYVQLGLIRDNLSLSEIIYKSDNNPEYLRKILAKLKEHNNNKSVDNNTSTTKFQEEDLKSDPNSNGSEQDSFEKAKENFLSFFDLRSRLIPIPDLPLYYLKVNSINFDKNIEENEKEKLLKNEQVVLKVDFSLKKVVSDIRAPYLVSSQVRSNYPPVLKASLAKIGKGSNSKVVLLDLGNLSSRFKVQLDYSAKQREIINTLLKENPEREKELQAKIESKTFSPIDLNNDDLLAIEFQYEDNPEGDWITLGRMEKLVKEVIQYKKEGKTFLDDEVAKTLYYLDFHHLPQSKKDLEEYKEKHKNKFISEIKPATPASQAKTSQAKNEKEVKPESAQAEASSSNSNDSNSKTTSSSSMMAGTTQTDNKSTETTNSNSTTTSSATTSTTSTTSSTTTSTQAATTSASSAKVKTTKFQEQVKEQEQKQEKAKETNQLSDTKRNKEDSGLGLILWDFLVNSKYKILPGTSWDFHVEPDSFNDRLKITAILKENTSQAKSNPDSKNLTSLSRNLIIKGVMANKYIDYLVQEDPVLLVDYTRRNQIKTEREGQLIWSQLASPQMASPETSPEKNKLEITEEGLRVKKGGTKIKETRKSTANGRGNTNTNTNSKPNKKLVLLKGSIKNPGTKKEWILVGSGNKNNNSGGSNNSNTQIWITRLGTSVGSLKTEGETVLGISNNNSQGEVLWTTIKSKLENENQSDNNQIQYSPSTHSLTTNSRSNTQQSGRNQIKITNTQRKTTTSPAQNPGQNPDPNQIDVRLGLLVQDKKLHLWWIANDSSDEPEHITIDFAEGTKFNYDDLNYVGGLLKNTTNNNNQTQDDEGDGYLALKGLGIYEFPDDESIDQAATVEKAERLYKHFMGLFRE
ncbi:P110/LppT family adhesin N-terminal domain [Mesomycoplasma hyopneumoniae]|uniref:P110/LppT family adhesin N-terminal domain n=1 Tax=Mesomycoplasma hyopneumoniae TaxID=2099 RepID=UPI00385758A0